MFGFHKKILYTFSLKNAIDFHMETSRSFKSRRADSRQRLMFIRFKFKRHTCFKYYWITVAFRPFLNIEKKFKKTCNKSIYKHFTYRSEHMEHNIGSSQRSALGKILSPTQPLIIVSFSMYV